MQVRAVILTDGKKGHQNQNLVISRMLGDDAPLIMDLRRPEGDWSERLLRLRWRLGGRSALSKAKAAALVPRMLRPDSPEAFRSFVEEVHASGRGMAGADNRGAMRIFTISTGTPPATMNLLLCRLLGAESIVNMIPSLLPLSRFDLCLMPQHDADTRQVPGNAIVSPLAIGVYDEVQAAFAAKRICDEMGLDRAGRYLGLAIGGPSKSAPWERDYLLERLGLLLRCCKAEGLNVLATTSRRTPGWFAPWLETRGREMADIPYILDAARDSFNPLPGFYDLCKGMASTADSFSMASEAVHAGLTPLLFRGSPAHMRPKLERGLQGIVATGQALWLQDESSVSAAVRAPRRAANLEYARLRGLVRQKLGLDDQAAEA